MAKTKRAKPITRELIRELHEEIMLSDLGNTLKEIKTTIDGLIAKYGEASYIEFEGPDYEGPDRLEVYSVNLESDAAYNKRRKKIQLMRRLAKLSAKKRAEKSAKLEAEIRARSQPQTDLGGPGGTLDG